MSFPMKTPMDKAIINKDKNESMLDIERVVVVKVKVWNIINFKQTSLKSSWEYSNTIILF
jgi:hypothetical protein